VVTEQDIQALADRIAAEFRPQRVVLFGSYALGTPREDSDVDLLVVLPIQGPRYRVAGRIRAILTPSIAIDVVVRSPQEYESSPGDVIVREARESGRTLFHRAA
jgi:predicted nucleotidyltransferase